MATADENLAEIRASVRALRFQGEYWRKLDRERCYPTEFVAALTEAGYLAAAALGVASWGCQASRACRQTGPGPNGMARLSRPRVEGLGNPHGSPRQFAAQSFLSFQEMVVTFCGVLRVRTPLSLAAEGAHWLYGAVVVAAAGGRRPRQRHPD